MSPKFDCWVFTYLSYLLHVDKKCSFYCLLHCYFCSSPKRYGFNFLGNIYIYALIFISGNILSVTRDSLGNNVFN